MKTWGGITGLIVILLVLAGPWTITPALPQVTFELRGWGLVDFKRDKAESAKRLWDNGGPKASPRWSEECSSERPNAEIQRIFLVRPATRPDVIYTRLGILGPRRVWEAIVLVRAATEEDFRKVEQYIEDCYTHVDLYVQHDEY